MKIKVALITIFLCAALPNLWAHHIVGGEIYLKSKGNNLYELGLHFYFNNNQTEISTEYTPLILTIFRKRDNVKMGNYSVTKQIEKNIIYSNTNCARSADVSTRYFLYTATITLSPSVFSDPEGYYVVWTSCYRNDEIKNINNPDNTCMVYYTEFPAVVQNGNSFIDSTPEFVEITGDYACINQAFSFDFSGTDADGDSLVYSLVNPLTFTGQFIPPQNGQTTNVSATNYHDITWATGYSLTNIIDATVPMSINTQTGMITFTANQLGLYAFSVKCREFRDGVEIGSVQRDFQLLVLNCETNNKPSFTLSQNGTSVTDGASLAITASGSRCFEVKASDKISGTAATSSTLTLSVTGTHLSSSSVTLSPASGTIDSDSDTLLIKACFSDCFSTENGEAEQVHFILSDNGCPEGLSDTLTVNLIAAPPVKPDIVTDLPDDKGTLKIGNRIDFNVIATQADGGSVSINAAGRNFDLTDVGMIFENNQTGQGTLTVPFDWTLTCERYQKRIDDSFIIDFVASNKNVCTPLHDTVSVYLNVRDTVINYDEFIPYNVFTPNGDTDNEVYELPGLPADNCTNSFERIVIINRWGEVVFESKTRIFSWTGKDYPTGTYFYLIQYSNKKYKGWLSLIR